jgi:hypothetical protein
VALVSSFNLRRPPSALVWTRRCLRGWEGRCIPLEEVLLSLAPAFGSAEKVLREVYCFTVSTSGAPQRALTHPRVASGIGTGQGLRGCIVRPPGWPGSLVSFLTREERGVAMPKPGATSVSSTAIVTPHRLLLAARRGLQYLGATGDDLAPDEAVVVMGLFAAAAGVYSPRLEGLYTMAAREAETDRRVVALDGRILPAPARVPSLPVLGAGLLLDRAAARRQLLVARAAARALVQVLRVSPRLLEL